MPPLLNAEQLDVEREITLGWDWAAPSGAIRKLVWNEQPAFSTNPHADHAAIPPRNHLSRAKLKIEWLATVDRGIKLLSVKKPPRVVDRDPLAGLCFHPFSFLDVRIA
jgi:hypothetical protein